MKGVTGRTGVQDRLPGERVIGVTGTVGGWPKYYYPYLALRWAWSILKDKLHGVEIIRRL